MKISILFVLLAAILWGTTGTTQAFAPKEAAPLVFGAVRMAVGGITLLLFAALRGQLKRSGWFLFFSRQPVRDRRRNGRRHRQRSDYRRLPRMARVQKSSADEMVDRNGCSDSRRILVIYPVRLIGRELSRYTARTRCRSFLCRLYADKQEAPAKANAGGCHRHRVLFKRCIACPVVVSVRSELDLIGSGNGCQPLYRRHCNRGRVPVIYDGIGKSASLNGGDPVAG